MGFVPWTAPNVERHPPPRSAAEREMLEAWLDFHRETLLWKCSGLSADQLRRPAVEPSNLSLLGLVRHMTDVERSWFRRRLAGLELPVLYRTETDRDGEPGLSGGVPRPPADVAESNVVPPARVA
jgi:hypothetical protein